MEKKFALLIDADNISPKYIDSILETLKQYGNVTIKRIYGDWTSTQHTAWKEELLEHAITPFQQFTYTQGKNSNDSSLIIDAMDILYGGNVDGFCIVSSDSDFTRLASRIRENGLMVIGMGEEKTLLPFRSACDLFIPLEREVQKVCMAQEVDDMEEVENSIMKCLKNKKNRGERILLSQLGLYLQKSHPGFDIKKYGYKKLSGYLKELPDVEILDYKGAHVVELSREYIS